VEFDEVPADMPQKPIDRLASLYRLPALPAVIAWSLIIGMVFMSVQYGIAWLYFLVTVGPAGSGQSAHTSGTLISIVTIAAALVCSGLIFLVVENSQSPLRDWLGLKPVSLKQLALWVLVLFLFTFLSNLVAAYFQHDVVTSFVRDLYGTSSSIYLLGFAVIIAAPFFEELFFRGFMLFGISRSRLGVTGGILITALIWTAVHQQYDWYIRGNILMLGIIFGYARHRSGSLLPSLTMHALMNAMALVEVAHL
jgi:membrane protease YdiL (CAAX protease family)